MSGAGERLHPSATADTLSRREREEKGEGVAGCGTDKSVPFVFVHEVKMKKRGTRPGILLRRS